MSKLLIIEDDPYVLRFYENLFRIANNNYQIISASNGQQGLQLCKNELPNLVLLDIVMPDINGVQVLEELKKDPTTQHIPVIMLTNISDTDTVRKCTELGASAFLVKSDTDPKDLVTKVEDYLKSYNL